VGDATVDLYCDAAKTIFAGTQTADQNVFTFIDACSYANGGLYEPTAVVTREGVTVEGSTIVTVTIPGAVEDCSNGQDDDGDFLVDGADPDCPATPCPIAGGVCVEPHQRVLDFGNWLEDTRSDIEVVTIFNNTGGDITFASIHIEGFDSPFFGFDPAADLSPLADGQTREVYLYFEPDSARVFDNATLRILTNKGVFSIQLKGTGVLGVKIGPIYFPLGLSFSLDTDSACDLIFSLVNLLFFLGLALSVVSFVIAAIFFMGSMGDASKVQTARNIIKWTLIALALLLIARAIFSIIFTLLAGEYLGC